MIRSRPLLMGIVNVTPDSFSDGGRFLDPSSAVQHGLRLVEEGADLLDIGGESTRPGAAPVSVQEEMDRVLPVIEGLRGGGVMISIDTRHAATMRAALAAGAGMINDVTALTGDPDSLAVAAAARVPVCLMHMRGVPGTMQDRPHYEDVTAEVAGYLAARADACERAGMAREALIVDPGIGFGKTLEHNLALLKNISVFKGMGCKVLIGVSRKSFIAGLCPGAEAAERLPGSLAAALWAAAQGADILRVHDVAATRQALAVFQALGGAGVSS